MDELAQLLIERHISISSVESFTVGICPPDWPYQWYFGSLLWYIGKLSDTY